MIISVIADDLMSYIAFKTDLNPFTGQGKLHHVQNVDYAFIIRLSLKRHTYYYNFNNTGKIFNNQNCLENYIMSDYTTRWIKKHVNFEDFALIALI